MFCCEASLSPLLHISTRTRVTLYLYIKDYIDIYKLASIYTYMKCISRTWRGSLPLIRHKDLLSTFYNQIITVFVCQRLHLCLIDRSQTFCVLLKKPKHLYLFLYLYLSSCPHLTLLVITVRVILPKFPLPTPSLHDDGRCVKTHPGLYISWWSSSSSHCKHELTCK